MRCSTENIITVFINMRVIFITISHAQQCSTDCMQKAFCPRIFIEYFFIDCGAGNIIDRGTNIDIEYHISSRATRCDVRAREKTVNRTVSHYTLMKREYHWALSSYILAIAHRRRDASRGVQKCKTGEMIVENIWRDRDRDNNITTYWLRWYGDSRWYHSPTLRNTGSAGKKTSFHARSRIYINTFRGGSVRTSRARWTHEEYHLRNARFYVIMRVWRRVTLRIWFQARGAATTQHAWRRRGARALSNARVHSPSRIRNRISNTNTAIITSHMTMA